MEVRVEEFRQRYSYTKQDLIGRGGFAAVYKARDTLLDRNVALKFYNSNQEKYGVLKELKLVLPLSHPNLVKYYDAITLISKSEYTDATQVYVGIMELANSGDFNKFLATFPNMEQIALVVVGIMKGLQYLHENKVIHRDLNPKNILMNQDEENKKNNTFTAKIADFGLGKHLDRLASISQQLFGTVEYMAPEQFDRRRFGIDANLHTNIDIWSLGIILYEMFTGSLPFGRRMVGKKRVMTESKIIQNILKKELVIEPGVIPSPYDDIIRMCLVKDAKRRDKDVGRFLEMLGEGSRNANSNSMEMPNEVDMPMMPEPEFDLPDEVDMGGVEEFPIADIFDQGNQHTPVSDGQGIKTEVVELSDFEPLTEPAPDINRPTVIQGVTPPAPETRRDSNTFDRTERKISPRKTPARRPSKSSRASGRRPERKENTVVPPKTKKKGKKQTELIIAGVVFLLLLILIVVLYFNYFN